MVLLEIAAVLAFISFGVGGDITNAILGGVLVALVLLTSYLSFWRNVPPALSEQLPQAMTLTPVPTLIPRTEERKAADVISAIRCFLPSDCKVLRGSRTLVVPAGALVVGDVVALSAGNRVPADLRVVQATDFKVEMASLTGESDAIECGAECRSALAAEARNLIFSSSLVMNGQAVGIVVRTGDATLIGRIAGLAGATKTAMTTMELEVRRVCKVVAVFAFCTGVAFLAIGLGRGLGVINSIVNAFILVLIAHVPEGLPSTVAAILTLTAQHLADHDVFVGCTLT